MDGSEHLGWSSAGGDNGARGDRVKFMGGKYELGAFFSWYSAYVLVRELDGRDSGGEGRRESVESLVIRLARSILQTHVDSKDGLIPPLSKYQVPKDIRVGPEGVVVSGRLTEGPETRSEARVLRSRAAI